MRSIYQPGKSHDYGVQFCAGCLDKQHEIDRLKVRPTVIARKDCPITIGVFIY